MELPKKLLIILSLLLIIVIFLALVLSGSPPKEAENETAAEPPSENLTAPPGPGVWEMLNRSKVEEQCLIQARAYANSQQLPAAFVFSCKCEANENEETKEYDCEISAADGKYQVDARCVKQEERCVFVSIGGSIVYTFDELESMLLD